MAPEVLKLFMEEIAAGSRSHRVTDARNVRERLSAELRVVDVFFVGAASSRDLGRRAPLF